MGARLIDFHCHLDLYPNPALAVERAVASGSYVLSVTTTPKAWGGTVKLAHGKARIRTALGLHPQIAHERHTELALFEGLLDQTRYVGEIGLDGAPELKVHSAIQKRVFDHILLACAKAGGRVMSIHSRRATTDVLDDLARHPDAGVPILHWFSGTKGELERAISMGCWFSVGPAMVASAKGRSLAAAMPPDRVLTETDGPFGASRRQVLQPGEVGIAEKILAGIWACGIDQARTRLQQTLCAVLSQ